MSIGRCKQLEAALDFCCEGDTPAEAAHTIQPDLKVVFTSWSVDRTSLPDDAAFVPKPWGVDDIAQAIHTVQNA